MTHNYIVHQARKLVRDIAYVAPEEYKARSFQILLALIALDDETKSEPQTKLLEK